MQVNMPEIPRVTKTKVVTRIKVESIEIGAKEAVILPHRTKVRTTGVIEVMTLGEGDVAHLADVEASAEAEVEADAPHLT